MAIGYEYYDPTPSPSTPSYDCHRCSWSGDNPRVLLGSSGGILCPECGATLKRNPNT